MSAQPLRDRWYGGFSWWVSADPRALGVFRIMLGLLCIWDVCRRIPWIELFLTNDGVVPNHYGLYRPHASHVFSFLFSFKTPGEVGVFFAGTLLCLTLFTAGYRTRLFQTLSALAMLSLHNRTIITENGGDVVLNLWWLWTFFLPLGQRFSIDAVRKSMRERVEKTTAALNAPLLRTTTPVWHFAVFCVIWQLVLIYLFNTLHKSGASWREGLAISWVYEQDRIVTDFGLWMQAHAPLWVSKLMTWGTLVIEGTAPILLLSPIFTTWCRRVTLSLLTCLHVGIYLITDVGLFSPVMIVAYFILLTPPDFELAGRWLERLAGAPIRVFYDSDCGVCTWCVRLLSRLDVLGRITWMGRDPSDPPPTGWSAERLAEAREHSVIVDDGATVRTDVAAVWRILAALPFLRLVVWPMRLPGISHLFKAAYAAFAPRRHRVSAWLGMGLCGLSGPDDGPTLPPPPPEPSRAQVQLRRTGWVLSHVALLICFAATQSQALVENRWIKKRYKHQQPAWAKAVVQYGRWFQGWSMFAPDAPRSDGHLVIEAQLPDGRIVDPQTGEPPKFTVADASDGARWDQFWGSFSMRIASRRNTQYREHFNRWLRKKTRHLELGPEDRLVRFKVWWIGDVSPHPLSGKQPVEKERYIITQWPKGKWSFDDPPPGGTRR